MWIEVASALRAYVAAGYLAQQNAHELLAYASRLPLETRQLRGLAASALDEALLRGLSVYDACYVVLAESIDAILVTADEGLALAAARSELIT